MSGIVIVGGGPAGMMAAIAAKAAAPSLPVTLLERGEKLGRKLYLTGKGRCNVTNNAPMEEFFANVPRNPKFLYSAFSSFSSADLMAFFADRGLALKVERGGRVFPASDKASDITRALEKELRALGVEIRFHTRVTELRVGEDGLEGLMLGDGFLPASAVVVATGGMSYPSTGSTGDGYAFARQTGHAVAEPRPSLVQLRATEDWIGTMAGLTLTNVELVSIRKKKPFFQERGELLFTHTGISGPLALSLSAMLPENISEVRTYIDLKPALSMEQLDARILRDIQAAPNRSLANALAGLTLRSLWDTIVRVGGLPADLPANSITRELRQTIAGWIKRLPVTISGTGTLEEAIITRGGVSVKEIHPGSMASKRLNGLFFAGEVLDVDAFTGGYNLQIGFSTGHLAGVSAAKHVSNLEGKPCH